MMILLMILTHLRAIQLLELLSLYAPLLLRTLLAIPVLLEKDLVVPLEFLLDDPHIRLSQQEVQRNWRSSVCRNSHHLS